MRLSPLNQRFQHVLPRIIIRGGNLPAAQNSAGCIRRAQRAFGSANVKAPHNRVVHRNVLHADVILLIPFGKAAESPSLHKRRA